MINRYTTGDTLGNINTVTNNINGEIVKVVVFTDTILKTVKLKLSSLDGEVLCDDYLSDIITRFYPKNTISVSQEQTHIENYNVAGPLLLNVEGLGDGEKIKNIVIYYR